MAALKQLFDPKTHKLDLRQAWPLIANSGWSLASMGNYGGCISDRPPVANMTLIPYRFCVLDGAGHAITSGVCIPAACDLAGISVPTLVNDLKDLEKEVGPAAAEALHLPELIGFLATGLPQDAAFYCGKHDQKPLDAGGVIMVIVIVILMSLAAAQSYVEHRSALNLSEEERAFLEYEHENLEQPVSINADGSRAVLAQRE